MKRRLYLQLGRMGDILNVLPLCHRDWINTGTKPLLMVAKPFLSLLEGVSYVEPVFYDGRFEDILGAYPHAEQIAEAYGAEIVCTQIYGENMVGGETCSSFMRESWDRVPNAPAWGTLPLLIDRRNADREREVVSQVTKHLERRNARPYVVLALSGTSSPFAHSLELSQFLRSELGEAFDFIDVSAFLAPRFYDLLGLLEGAHALVTIDSGLLHLAPAVRTLPVIAFVTREPSSWHGSPWRPQHLARFFYDEATECFPSVSRAITEARKPALKPRIWHVWSDYTPSGETARRMALARQTWQMEYQTGNWRPTPFDAATQARDSGAMGDSVPMPYVSDLVDHVLAHNPNPSDIIAITNADICFTPGLTGWIFDKVTRHGAAFTHRWDFTRIDRPILSEAAVQRGTWYPGSDAFFFTVEWWRAHGHEYPDMVLGRERCDEVLRQLVKRHRGTEIVGAIYHEKHESYWERDENLMKNAGNRHNRQAARRWFMRNGYAPNDYQWWKLPLRPF